MDKDDNVDEEVALDLRLSFVLEGKGHKRKEFPDETDLANPFVARAVAICCFTIQPKPIKLTIDQIPIDPTYLHSTNIPLHPSHRTII